MMNRNAISSPSAKDVETKAIRTSSLELKLSLTADEKEKEEWKMKNQSTPADANVVDGQTVPPGATAYGTDDILKMLSQMDDDNEDNVEEIAEKQ